MRKLPLIFSITLGLTSTVSANAMYECSLLDEGQTYAQMIKYENKFVEIFPTGEVEEFFCTSIKFGIERLSLSFPKDFLIFFFSVKDNCIYQLIAEYIYQQSSILSCLFT